MNLEAYCSIGREMDYTFVSSAFVIVAVFPATSFSRTVRPISYSFATANDGESESSIQYGTHTTNPYDADYDMPSKDLRHPSRLAHHYYDRPTKKSSQPLEDEGSTPSASTTGRFRQENAYYIRQQATTTKATTAPSVDATSTESILSGTRVRKKGRWLRVRNEIPVNEDSAGEVPPVSSPRPSPLIESDRRRVNRTLQPNDGGTSFGHSRNSSKPFRQKPEAESQVPKSPAKGGQHKWSYAKLTATENPVRTRLVGNSSRTTAKDLASAQVLRDTAEARVKTEIDFVTRKSKPKSEASVGRNLNQRMINAQHPPYSQLDGKGKVGRTSDATSQNENWPDDLAQPSTPTENAGLSRRLNFTASKTTPIPKYKEAYLSRPANRPRITPATRTSMPETGQFASNSNWKEEPATKPKTRQFAKASEKPATNFENRLQLVSTSTEGWPVSNDESEQTISKLENESAEEPGIHRESLAYSDTEKMEKSEQILQDVEYPDDEDEEVGEAADPAEESASKILQKPMRYSYSADQSHSESQRRTEPQDDEASAAAAKKEGGGEQHRSAHQKSMGDKAEEDYESAVEFDNGKKGHSDKENRKHHQEEERGANKRLREEGGHRALNRVSSKGEKATLFGESGSHKKGHSTKGSHNIHKKNEFLKKHEFYDEHHEDDEHKKYGDYHKGHKFVKDDTYKKQHKDGDYSEGHKGKIGKNAGGHRFRQHKGHDDAFKHVDHYAHSHDYGHKDGHAEGKRWKYENL